MTTFDKLVTAAAEALIQYYGADPVSESRAFYDANLDAARAALAAAFAEIPVEELKKQARVAACNHVPAHDVAGAADAASDVWIAAFTK